MNKGITLLLKTGIVLFGLAVLAHLAIFPQTEGAAVNKDLVSIYTDPIILYMYLASVAFFVGLYQAFRFLGFVEKFQMFSDGAMKAVRNVKYCAITFAAFMVGAEVWLLAFQWGTDDVTGPAMLGFLITIACATISAGAHIFEKSLDIKSKPTA